jgi:AcrR family transcriptional regulator
MNAFIFFGARGMTGRRELQKEGRRRRILKAASQLFETRGYEATGMGDIARRARLAVGTLYNYFPSKPEIALAVVRGRTSEALSEGEAVVKRPDADPVTAVTALFDLYLDTFCHFERSLWREILAAAMTDPEGLGAAFFAQDARLLQQLDALLRELRSRRSLGPDADSGRGAITLYGVYITWFMAYLANESTSLQAVHAELREGIRIVMQGLARPARPSGADPKAGFPRNAGPTRQEDSP